MMQITLVHIFYDQHRMLPLHQNAWKEHGPGKIQYAVIDDNSPTPITLGSELDFVSVYRVLDTINWNTSGARNLAFHISSTEWVLCADIDHIITADALSQILTLNLSDPNVVYIFGRKRANGSFGSMYAHNILMNRRRYFEVGGNDEDFAGNYAGEDTFFGRCLTRSKCTVVPCEDIILDWFPGRGGTKNLSRDKSTNALLYKEKLRLLKRDEYCNGSILRFSWTRIR